MGALNKTQPSRCPYQDSNTAPPEYNSLGFLFTAACLATVKFVGPFCKDHVKRVLTSELAFFLNLGL